MSVERWHLVGFVAQSEFTGPYPLTAFRIVSLCGGAGRIRPRYERDGVQGDLLVGMPRSFAICENCLALWDAAEESGLVVTMYTWNGKREWFAGNAPVVSTLAETFRFWWSRDSNRFVKAMNRVPDVRDRNGKPRDMSVIGALRFTTARAEKMKISPRETSADASAPRGEQPAVDGALAEGED